MCVWIDAWVNRWVSGWMNEWMVGWRRLVVYKIVDLSVCEWTGCDVWSGRNGVDE